MECATKQQWDGAASCVPLLGRGGWGRRCHAWVVKAHPVTGDDLGEFERERGIGIGWGGLAT